MSVNKSPLTEEDLDKVRDRSVRLYGANAQKLLEQSSVCLVNACAVGTEALKSLILAGIGSFSVVDDNVVTEADLGQNFFVQESDLGKNRAEVVAKLLLIHAVLLKEKNKSFSRAVDPVELLKKEPSYYNEFDVIILSNISVYDAKLFNDFAAKNNKNLLYVRSVGEIATLQVFSVEHVVVDSKSENDIHQFREFRIRNPWKELSVYCRSLDAAKVNATEIRHIPWVVILHNTLPLYQKKIGKAALVYSDLEGYRQFLKDYEKEAWADAVKRNDSNIIIPETMFPPFENFDEARTNAYQVLPHQEPSNLKQLFKVYNQKHANSSSPSSSSSKKAVGVDKDDLVSKFWVMIGALDHFVKENKGLLPVYPSLPDMEASSAFYTGLLQVYRDKAKADADALFSYAYPSSTSEVIRAEFQTFASHSLTVACISYRPLRLFLLPPPSAASSSSSATGASAALDEYDISQYIENPPAEPASAATTASVGGAGTGYGEAPSEEQVAAIKDYFPDWDPSHNIAYLPIIHAGDVFHERHHRYPGVLSGQNSPGSSPVGHSAAEATPAERAALYAADVAEVRKILEEFSTVYGLPMGLAQSTLVNDVLRSSFTELHAVSAVMGGITSQEAFKLVTHHYLPFNNTFVYNGYTCVSTNKEL